MSLSSRNVLVTGAGGLLGGYFVKRLRELGTNVWSVYRNEPDSGGTNYPNHVYLDLTETNSMGVIEDLIEKNEIDTIIHCAAAKNMKWCQDNRDLSWKINVSVTKLLALIAEKYGCKMVFMSSDAVFFQDGMGEIPREDTPTSAKSVYGLAKLWAEGDVQEYTSNHLIIRSATIYGNRPGNIGHEVLNSSRFLASLDLIQPTYGLALAEHICEMIDLECSGVWHVASPERCTRFTFAKSLLSIAKQDTKNVLKADSGKIFDPNLPRSTVSVLDISKFLTLVKDNQERFSQVGSLSLPTNLARFVAEYEKKKT